MRWSVLVVVVVCAACPETTAPPPVVEGCDSDRDCGGGAVCDKTNDGDGIAAADDDAGVCVEVGVDDCGRLLCEGVCNPFTGRCERSICDPRAPCDDAGLSCLWNDGQGLCQPVPERARCDLVLPPVAFDGDRVGVGVVAFDADDRLVRAEPFTITAVCAAGRCDQVVDAGCGPHTLRVLAPTTSGQRVLVFSDDGRALAGVAVRFDDVEVVTGDDGSVSFEGDAGVVSVLPVDHEAHTFIDPPRDLVVVTRRETALVTGALVTPALDRVHVRGDLRLSLNGAPLARDLSRFSLEAVFGGDSDVVVDVEGLTDGPTVSPLPNGVALGLGDTDFRSAALVAAAPTERLLVWTLATRLQLSQAGPLMAARGGFTRDLMLDLVSAFGGSADHGFTVVAEPGAPVVVAAADDDDGNGAPDGLPAADLPQATTRPDTFPVFSEEVPRPAAGNTQLTLVVVDVPGAGFVPLGLREAADDGLEIGDEELVDHAPPHDGLEGYAVHVVVVESAARPWSALDAVAVRVDGAAAVAAAPGSFEGGHAVVDEVAGDVAGLRVTGSDGHTWTLWTASAAAVDAAALGVDPGGSAVLASYDLDGGFALDDDGGPGGVAAVTRVPCEGACR